MASPSAAAATRAIVHPIRTLIRIALTSVHAPVGLHIVETAEEPAVPTPAPALAAPPVAPVAAPEITSLPEPILAPEAPEILHQPLSLSPLETVAPMAASDVVEVSAYGIR